MRVSSFLIDQSLCSLVEEWKNIIVYLRKVLADIHRACFYDIFGLRYSYPLKFDARLIFNRLDQHLRFCRVERDTGSTGTSSRSSTTSVDVSLCLLRWLNLNHEVDVGNVKATRCNISGDENAEFALLESLHRDFALVLSNIAMHDLNILLDFIRKQK